MISYSSMILQDFKDSNNNLFPGQPLDKSALDHRILDAIQRRAAARLHLGEADKPVGEAGCRGPAGGEAACLSLGQTGEADCLTLGSAGEPAGCLSLGLLNNFTTTSSATGSQPPPTPPPQLIPGL